MKKLFISLSVSLCFVSLAKANVIAVVGPTVSAKPYLSLLAPAKGSRQFLKADDTLETPLLSVHTKTLTPGHVKTRHVDLPLLAKPIYIIGDDALSEKWLATYAHRLKALHASGYLVNVSNKAAYAVLVQQSGLHPTPINGAALQKRFGLRHYPVLISQHEIEQ
jgi:integrating conjugative element protein (TIGR03765 family)